MIQQWAAGSPYLTWGKTLCFFHQFIYWLRKTQSSSGSFKEERHFLLVPGIEP
jgi:hypothetical protein